MWGERKVKLQQEHRQMVLRVEIDQNPGRCRGGWQDVCRSPRFFFSFCLFLFIYTDRNIWDFLFHKLERIVCCQLTVSVLINELLFNTSSRRCRKWQRQTSNRAQWVGRQYVGLYLTFHAVSDQQETEAAHTMQTDTTRTMEENRYLPLVVGAHVQIAQYCLRSHFVIQLLVSRSVVSWPEIESERSDEHLITCLLQLKVPPGEFREERENWWVKSLSVVNAVKRPLHYGRCVYKAHRPEGWTTLTHSGLALGCRGG